MASALIRRAFLASGALVVVCALAATGQAQTLSSASVQGKIVDETGGALPGVTVTASSPVLQSRQVSTVSEGDGTYRLVNLPLGTYRLSFEIAGFTPVVRDELQLNAGFTAKIDVALKVGSLQESLTVTGQSPLVDVTSTTTSSNFGREALDAAPTARHFGEVFSMTPGIRTTTIDVGGTGVGSDKGSGFNYGTTGQQTPLVEGINTRLSNGASIGYIDFNSIEDVEIKTSGNGPEVATPGTAYNVILKSGGNDFHGTYVAGAQHSKLQSDNVDDHLRSQGVTQGSNFKRYKELTGDLGGRILRDQLWFYGNLRTLERVTNVIGYAIAPGPDGKYGTTDDIPGENILSTPDQSVKLSYQATDKYRVVGFLERDTKFEVERGGNRYTPREATFDYFFPAKYTKIELQAVPAKRVLFDVHMGWSGYGSHYDAHPGADVPGNPSRYDQVTLINTGPVAIPVFRYRGSPQFGGSLSFFPETFLGGKHTFKLGFTQLRELVGFNYLNKASGNYQLIYSNGQPFQIATYNRPVVDDKDRQIDSSVYLKDTWTIRRLTASLGLRFQQYHNYTEGATKEQGDFGSAGTFSSVDAFTSRVVEPRIGVALDPWGNAKTVFRVFFGRFHLNPGDDFADAYNQNTLVTSTFKWRDLDGNNDYTPGEVNLNPNGTDFVSITGSNNLLNPNLKLAATDEISGGVEHEIIANLGARVQFVYKRDHNLTQSVNVLRPYSAWNIPITRRDPGPDGLLSTADDGGTVTFYDYDPVFRGTAFVGNMVQNQPDDNSYKTIEVTLVKRPSRRWDVTTSVLATKNHREIVGIPQSPNDDFNRLDETWSWSYKLVAGYRLPYDVQVGAVFQAISGKVDQRTYRFATTDPNGGRPISQASTVTLRLEPFGAQQYPTQNALNLRLAKQLALGRQRRLKLAADVFNALNANAPLTISYASGPTFGAISSITPPRIGRLAVTFTF